MRLLEVGRRGPHVQLHDLLARELLEAAAIRCPGCGEGMSTRALADAAAPWRGLKFVQGELRSLAGS